VPEYTHTSPDSTLDYRLIAAASLLLSLWLILIDPIVTRDAIIYLRAADAYLQDGLFASQQVFGRPLLPIVIGMLNQLTGIPLLYVGLILNSLFYALLSVCFVATTATLGGNRRVQTFAALVILFHPVIADYRSSILRDPAFWAFMLLAFRSLLLYARQPTLSRAVGWFCYVILASLFRFEGLFFALLAPLSLLLLREEGRVKNCLRLLAPSVASASVFIGGAVYYQLVQNPQSRLFPDIQTYLRRLQDLPQQFQQLSAQTGEALLAFSAQEDAVIATIAGLFSILLLNICRSLTWPWVATGLWGLKHNIGGRLRTSDRVLLNAHLAISLLYLSLYVLLNHFMLERYCNIFTLFALLYIPFALNLLWQGSGLRRGKIVAAMLLLALSLDTLHNTNYKKGFIRDAAQWIEQNTNEQSTLITNDRYIAYFSYREVEWARGKPADYKFGVQDLIAQPQRLEGIDYLAISVDRRERERWQTLVHLLSLQEVAVFDGGRHGQISVVKLR
jgi:4-amino-4-deoxy-L-arabinose transferase-like glycosyltransferase